MNKCYEFTKNQLFSSIIEENVKQFSSTFAQFRKFEKTTKCMKYADNLMLENLN
jgi:hypothetical protein